MNSADLIIIITGALAAGSCALLGVFLILRKMALLGDAISHAVLPGIAIAFLLSGSRGIGPMFVGAAIFGVLAVFLIELLHKKWRVQEDASIGIIFTALFAIGVVLISAYAGDIDLDQECVLYGEIAYTPWDLLIVNGQSWGPRPLWLLGIAFVLDVLLVGLFYKELKLASFDAALATAMGINAAVVHYVLMGAVSVTTVASFESVGAILVVAMLIVPAATAYLLTDRLHIMLFLAVGFGFLSSIFGYVLAGWWDSSIAGAMTVAAGGMFTLALIASPKYGALGKLYNQFQLGVQYATDHILLSIIRHQENHPKQALSLEEMHHESGTSGLQQRLALRRFSRGGLLLVQDGTVQLSDKGKREALQLLKGHRMWETFLNEKVGLPADHTHEPANEMEHYISDELLVKLEQEIGDFQRDPQGKKIP